MDASFLSSKTLIIPANGHRNVDTSGQLFVCKESSGPFQMSMDSGERFDMEVGLSFRLANGDRFRRLSFYNDAATDLELTFYTGVGEVKDARLNSLISRALLVGTTQAGTRIQTNGGTAGLGNVVGGLFQIGAAASFEFAGTDVNGMRRKQIIISNVGTDRIYLKKRAASASYFGFVDPDQAWTCETSAYVAVYNPSGGPVDLMVCEMFYTETTDDDV